MMRRVRRFLALAVACAAMASCALSQPGDSGPDTVGAPPAPRLPVLARCPAAGSRSWLPPMSLTCLGSGPAVSTTALGGRPVLINLWASWCWPCQKEMPALQAAYARYGNSVDFLGVDTKDSADSAKDFLAAVAVHYPQVVDEDGDLLHGLGGAGLPVTLILDPTGRTVYSHRGELRPTDLAAALRAAGLPPPA